MVDCKYVIFLISGEARTFPFGLKNKSEKIFNSYNNFFFNKNLSNNYEYKVFLYLDEANVDQTIEFFTEKNIGNIYLEKTDFLFNPTYNKHIFNQKRKQLRRERNKHGYKKPAYFQQFLKLMFCYDMYVKSEFFNESNILIRMRPDISIDEIHEINNNNIDLTYILRQEKNLYIRNDQLIIGKSFIVKHIIENVLKNITFDPSILDLMKKKFHVELDGLRSFVNQKWLSTPEFKICYILFSFFFENNISLDTINKLNNFNIKIHRNNHITVIKP